MSRISEALMRAAAQANTSQKPPARRREEEAGPPFVSAWDLDQLPSERTPGAELPVVGDVPSGLAPSPMGEGQAARAGSVGTVVSSVRLESQLAMSWPQPFSAEVSEKLVVMRETNAAAVEQYRRLGAALLQAQRERGVKTVMVASAIAGEGKTLTAANLALTLGEASRRRVLLIDTNVHQPRMHQLFQVSAGTGLNGCLRSTAERGMPVIELTRSLSLLPAGRPQANPDRVLGSDRMRKVLAEAAASFDWVILDTAAVALRPDARLLAAFVDVAVLVIEARKTPQSLIEAAVEALGRDRLLGVVLNRAHDSAVAAQRDSRAPSAARWIR